MLILPWNLKDEIVEQLGFIREWGGRFAARTPELTLLLVMQFIETPLPGAWVIEPEEIEDERGWFARTFDAEEFRERAA